MELSCPNCQQTLRVKDSDAGKQARCPKCQTVFAIPGESQATSASPDREPVGDSGLWHLRIEDGRTFGPVDKAELDQWLGENRITANCQLRRDSDPTWRAAGSIFPQLGSPTADFGAQNPFRDDTGQVKPYQAPVAGPSGYRYAEPHRGGVVLTLGILGVVCCCICGIIAWAMGASDLKKMDQGLMDPEGRGLTMAGYILGIIGVILNVLIFGLKFLVAMAESL